MSLNLSVNKNVDKSLNLLFNKIERLSLIFSRLKLYSSLKFLIKYNKENKIVKFGEIKENDFNYIISRLKKDFSNIVIISDELTFNNLILNKIHIKYPRIVVIRKILNKYQINELYNYFLSSPIYIYIK